MGVAKGRYEIAGPDDERRGLIKAIDTYARDAVAIRILTAASEPALHAIRNEVQRLLALGPHRSIPRVRDDLFLGDDYGLVMDWIEGTDLQAVLSGQERPGLPYEDVLKIVTQVASAVDFLHATVPPIVHGAIRPENIITTPEREIFLVGFAVCGMSPARMDPRTFAYLAPELLDGEVATLASDVFSLGATAFALLTGHPPRGLVPELKDLPDGSADTIRAALRSALAADPADRPSSAGELVRRLGAFKGSATASGDVYERRIVTAFFADLVGFTTLSERWDAEDVATIQDRYFAAARQIITDLGGRLGNLLGDAVMALWVNPGRADDPERAVHAGLELIAAVKQISAELGLASEDLQLRVGITTGDASVRRESSDPQAMVTGDTVNVAARLQSSAAPDSVLVDESTMLRVAQAFDVEHVGSLALKGKSSVVAAWRVVAPRSEISRESAMGHLSAPMIGREEEMSELLQVATDLGSNASEQWLIVAPPGVGKTRLVGEFLVGISHQGLPALSAMCRQGAGSYEPIAQLLRAALSRQPGIGGDEITAEMLTHHLRARLLPHPGDALDVAVLSREVLRLLWPHNESMDVTTRISAADERDFRFAAWLGALEALVPGPCVWMVEDIQWASGDLLAFLERARQSPPAGGRLVVATSRPSILDDGSALQSEAGENHWHVLHLRNLNHSAIVELTRALAGSELPTQVADEIAARSDGAPLFVEELLRSWISSGILIAKDSGVDLARSPDDISVPGSVQAVYAAQIDDLPTEARFLARRASVAGSRFPVAALAALGVEDPEPAIEVLVRRGLLSGPAIDPQTGVTYSYRHALLRDAAYESLSRSNRTQLHSGLARWLEEKSRDQLDAVADQIGHHYLSALRLTGVIERGGEAA